MTPCFQPLRIKGNNCLKSFVTIFYHFQMKRSDMLFSSALYFTGHSFSNVHLSFLHFWFFLYYTVFFGSSPCPPTCLCVASLSVREQLNRGGRSELNLYTIWAYQLAGFDRFIKKRKSAILELTSGLIGAGSVTSLPPSLRKNWPKDQPTNRRTWGLIGKIHTSNNILWINCFVVYHIFVDFIS